MHSKTPRFVASHVGSFPEQSAQVSFPGNLRTWETMLCLSSFRLQTNEPFSSDSALSLSPKAFSNASVRLLLSTETHLETVLTR